MKDWHTRDISDIVLETGTDINQGRKNLSSDRKRKKNNKIFLIPSADSSTIIKKMASDASLSLLIVAYLLSCFIGSISDSITGILIIGIAFFCGAYIKYRSSLRISNSYRMLLPQAKVVENGTNFRLSIYDVEVGEEHIALAVCNKLTRDLKMAKVYVDHTFKNVSVNCEFYYTDEESLKLNIENSLKILGVIRTLYKKAQDELLGQ